ncbi:hypothetical protein [Alicyclobacillus herbarius]|uniref:hypothetical protein n=1 Tax=Alicyclobacillus herbarius TaxID=122960 RepID=UPI000404C9AF|nr:hypothetical protein [Alicyclobacillus herbarius]
MKKSNATVVHATRQTVDTRADKNFLEAFARIQREQEERRREEALRTDKADLLALLALRFGLVPREVSEFILNIEDTSQLERLILIAANVPTWTAFVKELKAPKQSFRIVGEQYRPF